MKTSLFRLAILLCSTFMYAQSGHIMQGVGAVNMSMGGASTAQPLDISGAMQWNPAALSVFDSKSVKLDVGLFFSSPELSSSAYQQICYLKALQRFMVLQKMIEELQLCQH